MKNQCQSPGDYCGSDSQKLAGTVPPCPVCAPFMGQFRELGGWKQGTPGRFAQRKGKPKVEAASPAAVQDLRPATE